MRKVRTRRSSVVVVRSARLQSPARTFSRLTSNKTPMKAAAAAAAALALAVERSRATTAADRSPDTNRSCVLIIVERLAFVGLRSVARFVSSRSQAAIKQA